MKIHIVKNGESLYSISQKYGVPLEELIKMNPQLKDPNEIDVGMKIKVPSSSHPQTGHEIVHKHVVKEGDTLWKLSKAWGVPLQEMIEANPHLKNPNVLVIGQVVNIPKVSGMMPPSSDGMPMHHSKGEMTAPKPKAELTAPKPKAEITPPKAELTKPKPEVTAPKPEVKKPKVEITLPKYELEFEMEKVEYYKPEKPKHEYPICPPAPTLPIPAPPIMECPEPPAILPYMEEKPNPFYSCCPEPYAPVKEMGCGCGEPHYHHPFAQYPVPAAEVVAPSAVSPIYAGCPPWQTSPVMQPPHGCGGGYPLMPYSHSSAQPVFVSPAAVADPAPTDWSPFMSGHHEMGEYGKWHSHHGMGGYEEWNPHHGMGGHEEWNPHHGTGGHEEWNPHHGMGGYEEWNPHHGTTGHGEWQSHTGHVYPGMYQTYVSPEAGWHNPEPYWGMPHGWEKGKTCVHPREEEPEAETATTSSTETAGEPEERNENTGDKEKKVTIRNASGKKSPRSTQKAKASSRKQRAHGMPWISG
ncbi:LysM peptidoglycan-binding domain-containing protein [Paenibacillus dendritiformis]|uniref:LysM repeat protein n=1 Tax=Paenibacillus dendritiformis C454 TaxID=1131935 RepID=H3SFA4_9BACL|nr:LysM peptidoglycan-binding domain-containing protein [Paenibacillus dendritiformis]EHQ62300.1 LysM repeat protein [Paenibacillus dendritiformis C454]CAH8769371.1 LysM peptidoglycan-binding domain-containing protein [Paenibacillus dendritiformis]